MKIFKNALKVTMGLTLLFLFSCEKDQISPKNNSLTDEINAVVTKFNDGGPDKIETLWIPGCQKNEKVTEEKNAQMLVLRKELEKSYSKQVTYLKSGGNTVGVIKDGTCGPYSELYLYMDCEDNNSASKKVGWTGSSFKNSAGNIGMYFCIVNSAYFTRTTSNYAVLDFSGASWPNGVSKITNWMDTEDSRNINSFKLGGNNILDESHGNTVVSHDGVKLGYYYYPQSSTYTDFPDLGISYGVFGTFGSYNGYLFSDNEDGSSSWISLQKWSEFTGTGLEPNISYPNNITGIVGVDSNANTTMWISKAR